MRASHPYRYATEWHRRDKGSGDQLLMSGFGHMQTSSELSNVVNGRH
jgi:hypothetical protein